MWRFKIFAFKVEPEADIEIVVNFVDAPMYLAASGLVNHPKSVKKKYLYTDAQLARYNDFIESALTFIMCHRVKMIKQYQSGKSYAYYVHFYPLNEEGRKVSRSNCCFSYW